MPKCLRFPVSRAHGPSLFKMDGEFVTRHLLIASLAAALAAGTASADTLREALASTYRSNPTLTGQREALKSTDAGVAIARAGGRPTVSAPVGVTRDLSSAGALR